MLEIETTSKTEKYRERCEDRVHVIADAHRVVLVVADGAGGTGSGARAATQLVDLVTANYREIHSANEWVEFLRQADVRIGIGETTGIVIDIRPVGIAGASVGDSEAWIFTEANVSRLTHRQNRKPLLGSGDALPVGFQHGPLTGTLLAGTDGLFTYAKADKLTEAVAQSNFIELPRKLIELVRLPSGDLWDDVGIIAARPKVQSTTRQKYAI